MKILFNCHMPFMLAHGGAQIQIEQTKAALEKIGIEVEPMRWWDETQTGDILQHFGRIPTNILLAAQRKGMKVIMSDLLTEAGSRSRGRLKAQKLAHRVLTRVMPESFRLALDSHSYRLADACLALTPWEAHLMRELFDAPASKIHVVPNGVEEVFLDGKSANRGKWLVCTATIVERKRVLELAQAAVLAQTPLWVIGKPYSQSSSYVKAFSELTRQHSEFVRFEGPINDRKTLAQIYGEARGFVLLSTIESLSLSALESAARGCPLLLSDLPWARTAFGENASYCPVTSPARTAPVLKQFYDRAPNLKKPPRPATWIEVARQLEGIYETVLKTSR